MQTEEGIAIQVRGEFSPKKGTKSYAMCIVLKSLAFNGPGSKYELAKKTGLSWAYVHRMIKELRRGKLVKQLKSIMGQRHPVTPYCATAQGLYSVFLLDEDVEKNWTGVLRRNRPHLEQEQVELLELSVPPIAVMTRNPLEVAHYEEAIIDACSHPFATDQQRERIIQSARGKLTLKGKILEALSKEISSSREKLRKMEILMKRLSGEAP